MRLSGLGIHDMDDERLLPSGWVSPWHFGINQGPIVIMMENYRSGLVWQLARGCRYLVAGLRAAGFAGGWLSNDLRV